MGETTIPVDHCLVALPGTLVDSVREVTAQALRRRGYTVYEARNAEEAIEWAKRCPNPTGEESVLEIRPVFEAEDFGEEVK